MKRIPQFRWTDETRQHPIDREYAAHLFRHWRKGARTEFVRTASGRYLVTDKYPSSPSAEVITR